MGVKTYQAYSMSEALDAAKRDLGADAVVLETRTFRRGGIFGLGQRSIFELTATSAETPSQRVAMPQQARAAYARQSAYTDQPGISNSSGPMITDQMRTRRLAQEMVARYEREARTPSKRETRTSTAVAPRGVNPPPNPPAPPALPAPPTTQRPVLPARPATPTLPVARRFILTCPDADRGGSAVTVTAPETLGQELAVIKDMVGRVLERDEHAQGEPVASSLPGRLSTLYRELIEQEVSEELADQVAKRVRDELPDSALDDENMVRETVLRHLAAYVPAAEPAFDGRRDDGRPYTIALVGPTGVGKTTTLAKLAASYKLRDRRNVGLVTCDTYRIAAVEQLRTYAGIIGVPLEVALSATEMQQALRALRHCDTVLIDTAGRGPNDTLRLDELQRCLEAADPHEVHLVLSSTSSERVLLREVEAFASVGADRVVMTKLDEAVTFGVLVNVMKQVGKRLSYITTGQEVPDHIEVGRSRRLAELVLGAPVNP